MLRAKVGMQEIVKTRSNAFTYSDALINTNAAVNSKRHTKYYCNAIANSKSNSKTVSSNSRALMANSIATATFRSPCDDSNQKKKIGSFLTPNKNVGIKNEYSI